VTTVLSSKACILSDVLPTLSAQKALRVNLPISQPNGEDAGGFVMTMALRADDDVWLGTFARGLARTPAGCLSLLRRPVSTPGPVMISITGVGRVAPGKMFAAAAPSLATAFGDRHIGDAGSASTFSEGTGGVHLPGSCGTRDAGRRYRCRSRGMAGASVAAIRACSEGWVGRSCWAGHRQACAGVPASLPSSSPGIPLSAAAVAVIEACAVGMERWFPRPTMTDLWRDPRGCL